MTRQMRTGGLEENKESKVSKELKKKGKVQLVGFGTFETSKRAARKGKNPATGEAIKIPAAVVPKFKAGKALKDLVNGTKKK